MIDPQGKPPRSSSGRKKIKKTSQVKEIEDWVCGDADNPHDATRHAGQLAENVTEERLLKARLMEMGKERFKFLTKYAYERQRFTETQKRKIAAMKKVRGTTALSESGSVRMDALHPSRGRDANSASLPIQRSFSPVLRPRTVQFEADLSRTYITKGAVETRPKTVPANGRASRIFNADSYQQVQSVIALDSSYNEWSRPSTAGVGSGYNRTMPMFTDASRDNSTSKYGSKFASVTGDPRFAMLDKALSENYMAQTKLDVRTIIDRTNSLRQAGRTGTVEARKALEMKVKQFMEENGIVF